MKLWFLTWNDGSKKIIAAPTTDAAVAIANNGIPISINRIDYSEYLEYLEFSVLTESVVTSNPIYRDMLDLVNLYKDLYGKVEELKNKVKKINDLIMQSGKPI